jgi:Rieske 2Fe-2S family protein
LTVDLDRIASLLQQRQPGYALPQQFYNDPDVLAFDRESVFGTSWLLAGFEAEVPDPGSAMVFAVGRGSVIVLRDRDGTLRAFHNTCRHRGSQIMPAGSTKISRLTCPYHQWTYGLDGCLLGAARMPPGFDRAAHGLGAVRVETVAGTIYVCLADDPPEFAPFRAALEPLLAPHDLRNAKVAVTLEVVERANWKLVMENARECYHCPAGHPDLRVSFPMDYSGSLGADENARSIAFSARMAALGLGIGPLEGEWWQVARFALHDGCVSISPDGKSVSRIPLCAAGGGDVGSLRWALEPNDFCHAAGDYVMAFSAMPTGPEETLVRLKFLVHKDAEAGIDYDPDRLIQTWNRTNDQDRDLAENNQRGVNSAGYRPGPYSEDAESNVIRFVDWYCDKASRFIAARHRRMETIGS